MRLPSLRPVLFVILVGLVLTPALGAPRVAAAPTGFAPEHVEAQLACEARLLALPRPQQFREHLQTITR